MPAEEDRRCRARRWCWRVQTAQAKTNVLDAISLLSPGRGLRGGKLAEHTRKGPSLIGRGAAKRRCGRWPATVARGETDYEIGTGLTQASASRQVRLNGRGCGQQCGPGRQFVR